MENVPTLSTSLTVAAPESPEVQVRHCYAYSESLLSFIHHCFFSSGRMSMSSPDRGLMRKTVGERILIRKPVGERMPLHYHQLAKM
jgi:hypothetical protein